MAEARCPNTVYEEHMKMKMTKAQIVKELKKYGVDATLRPRKSTLLELLREKENDEIQMIYDGPNAPYNQEYKPLDISVFEEMTKVEPKKTWVDYTTAILAAIGIGLTIIIGLALIVHWIS